MEQERIDFDDTDDDGTCGWPLGLLPVNARLSGASSSSTMILPSCTPTSSSSASSSNSDSESTTSFFPDGTTLGTLIGIQSSSQFALAQDPSADEKHKGRSTRHSILCSFLRCGGRLDEDSVEASPSLSHYWGMERREIPLESQREDVVQQRDLEDGREVQPTAHNNGSFRNESWPHPDSCGTSLRLFLQQHSPTSSWSDFNELSHHHSMRSDRSRLHNLWVGCCCKLSSSLST